MTDPDNKDFAGVCDITECVVMWLLAPDAK